MAVKITGDMNLLKLMIERDGNSAFAASLKVMDEKADEIVQLAKDNAPVDKHNLEEAIFRTPEKVTVEDSHFRNPSTGQFVKQKITIGVKDEMADKTTGERVNIAQYKVVMHESDRAGHGSSENDKKRAEGKNPGNKYLERAFNEIDPTIEPTMIAKVRASI